MPSTTLTHPLRGVYAAALTPLTPDDQPDSAQLSALLEFLAAQGCHGTLLLGTTGEGPSFSPAERVDLFEAASRFRQTRPDFKLLAGTGTPSLTETIELTRRAFDLGFDGVVVLPPYYFRTASDEGLFRWLDAVLQQAVPTGKYLLGYHIPQLTGLPFSLDLLARLAQAHPGRFAGLKDSSGDLAYCQAVSQRFGDQLLLLNGNDRLFTLALENGAQGCITAMANLHAPLMRRVWQAYLEEQPDGGAQAQLNHYRTVLERFQPFAPALKTLLAASQQFPLWPVRPPLLPLEPHRAHQLLAAMQVSA